MSAKIVTWAAVGDQIVHPSCPRSLLAYYTSQRLNNTPSNLVLPDLPSSAPFFSLRLTLQLLDTHM